MHLTLMAVVIDRREVQASDLSNSQTGSIDSNGDVIGGDGNGGDISITTQHLQITNGGGMSGTARGKGNAGNLLLHVDTIQLADGSRLSAEVNGGEQGNIGLATNELLVLRRGSAITATATGRSTGGNIEIRSPFIVGILGENSDIVANAVQGDGGNIAITTQGLFGIEFRDRLTPNNDITASSEFGLDGTVEINNPEADPSSQVLELPDTLVDASQLVRPGCSLDEEQFVLAGRGGLPSSPTELVNGDRPWLDLRNPLHQGNRTITRTPQPSHHPTFQPQLIQEATGIAIAPNGTLQLVASHSQNATMLHAICTSYYQSFVR